MRYITYGDSKISIGDQIYNYSEKYRKSKDETQRILDRYWKECGECKTIIEGHKPISMGKN